MIFIASPVFSQMEEKEWSLIFIVNGSNSLVDEAIKDLKSIASVGSSDQVNILVHFAKSVKSKGFMNWTGLKTFYVKKNDKYDAKEAIDSDVVSQIKSKESINRLISELKIKFPARKYMTIFWDHANILNRPPVSPQPPFADPTYRNELLLKFEYYKAILGMDENVMDFEEFTRVLPKVPDNSRFTPILSFLDNTTFVVSDLKTLNNNTSDILLFDACLLANLEMAKILKGRTEYMIASQEVIKASKSHRYDDLLYRLIKNPLQSPSEFANLIMSQFRKNNKHRALSLIVPENISPILNELEEFSIAIIQAINKKSISIGDIGLIRNKCSSLGEELSDKKTIDFIDFLKKFKRGTSDRALKNKAKHLLRLFRNNEIVKINHPPHYSKNLNGISIYYPDFSEKEVDEEYVKITPTKSWNELLIKIETFN
ncbi:clostripain-related cysteine peptidase [Maribacter sp. 2308TA10-17]|uniref:clostripain-related cysteine peptidase n=1 Tax=Maribacter sp. 2308TA10-17 TaxID=3386276 RepID=UPI0039BC7198